MTGAASQLCCGNCHPNAMGGQRRWFFRPLAVQPEEREEAALSCRGRSVHLPGPSDL